MRIESNLVTGTPARWLAAMLLVAACRDESPDAGGVDDTGTAGNADGGSSTAATPTGDGAPAAVTYHADARPILERHCTRCHTDEGIAFSLTDYESANAYREAIALAVDNGTMPPWGMADDCNTFDGDFSLSDADKEILTSWVELQAPEGLAQDYVEPSPIVLGSLSRTDLTLQLPEPYQPKLEPDDYHCTVLDWPHDDEMFITGVEIAPDNKATVHHLLLYLAEPEWVDDFEALDAAEEGEGYTCFGGPGGGNLPTYFGPTLAVWAPGNQTGDFPEGTGIAIAPGSKLIVQVHYNTLADNGLPDQSQVLLKTDAQVDRVAHLVPWTAPTWRLDDGMRIPAGEGNVEHEFAAKVSEVAPFLAPGLPTGVELELYMATHHMHGLGTTGRLDIVRANGDTQCLADLPSYDFNWQLMYNLSAPAIVSPDDEVRIRCGFDNSNGANDVFWGDGTTEEMCLGFFYAVPR